MAHKNIPTEADYVVVGGGSAGCAVAGRLAASGASVILIEAGKNDRRNFMVNKPGMIGPMHAEPKLKATVDWGYHTVPQANARNRELPQPRGKVLGGSSSINGLLWVRGNRANYDSWAAEGNVGWDADSVNEVYQRVEDFEDGADAYRGAGGPIKVTRHNQPTEASLSFQQAAADTLSVKILHDYNGAEQEGVSIFQQSAAGGRRYSAARGYLHNQDLPTLTTLTQVHATKVVIENGRAVGVQVADREGPAPRRPGRQRGHRVCRRLRVTAAADALRHRPRRPPQRSTASRRSHELPVGDNLHDHMFVPLTFEMPTALHRGTRVALRQGLGQGAHPRQLVPRELGLRDGRASCGRRSPPMCRTSRSTSCPGRTHRPTRTRPSGTRSTSARP